MGEEKKEIIFEKAKELFYKQGYSATGVREIAKSAGVNVSMISYYFGCKAGILKEIINRFFDRYNDAITESMSCCKDSNSFIRTFIEKVINIIKEDPTLCRVAVYEIPFNCKQITSFKVEKIKALRERMAVQVFPKFEIPIDVELLSIIGPALISLMFSHFLLKPIVSNVYKDTLSEGYYDKYKSVISTIFIDGIEGIKKQFASGELK